MQKRRNFFSKLFYIFLTLGVKLHIHLLNVVVRFIVFLTSATLTCRGTDISKCFREFLGIRDNESRLYLIKGTAFFGQDSKGSERASTQAGQVLRCLPMDALDHWLPIYCSAKILIRVCGYAIL